MAYNEGFSTEKKSDKPKEKKSFSETFIPHRSDSSAVLTNKLITMLSVIVVIACLVILGDSLFQMVEAKKNHNTLKLIYRQAQQVTASDPVQTIPSPDVLMPSQDVSDEPAPLPPLDILPAAKELLDLNPNTVGYVNIPGCVDEPVVQGDDNDYYLSHNFYENKRQCGTCFADYRSNTHPYERSDVITLYAHNQKDGTMFGNLDYYRWDPAYWLKNPFIYFNTNYTEDVYVIISSFVINTLPEHDDGKPVFDYQNYINFNDQRSYDTFISEVTKRSQIITGIDCSENDDYLILSTCSTEWDESRHLLVARKLRSDETKDSIDTTNFSKNPNPKWPAIYYKYNGGAYIEE